MPLTTKPQRGAPVLVDQATGNGSFSIMAGLGGPNGMDFEPLTLANSWVNSNITNRGETGALRWGPFVNFRMALDKSSATNTIVGVLAAPFVPEFNINFPVAFIEISTHVSFLPFLTIRGNVHGTPGQVEIINYAQPDGDDFWASVTYWVGL